MKIGSIYEYDARAGFWRLHRLLTSRCIPLTASGVATTLMRNPVAAAFAREAAARR